ncbi:hypothetical protein [Candidatus Poriferisodalis sp.]|uniref:hypothetical protein n=1 Tax=Candidatus Poriferisodalis sp. TaxID=3101277 RepID=UPI003B5CF4E1
MGEMASRHGVAALVVTLALSAGACTSPPILVAPTSPPATALSLDITQTTLLPEQASSERPAAVLVTVPSDAAAQTSTSERLGAAAIPNPEGVVLAGDGLGLVSFGAGVQAALGALITSLGQPVTDTGWIDTFSIYGDCPGSRLRVVEWPGVLALFGNPEDGYQHRDAGEEHFMTWRLGSFGPDPYLLRTAEGIGIGATRSEVAEAYPAATFRPATASEPASVLLATSGGRLTGILDGTGILRSLEAGTRCPTG